MKRSSRLDDLPGGVLVAQGLCDFQAGRQTIAACLVGIARGRFVQSGLLEGDASLAPADSELQLYRLLRAEGGDAYSRYNSLLRELVSFTQAWEWRQRKSKVQRLK